MKKIFKKIIICTAAMALWGTVSANASANVHGVNAEKSANERSILLEEKGYSSITAYGEPRGSIISAATISITNEGYGKAEILIETLAQKKSDEIRHVAILEKEESDGSWTEIARYDFDAVKEDFENQDLSGLTNQFIVSNLETECYYRVRGIHYVWLDGKSQAFSTQTEALLLKKYPG